MAAGWQTRVNRLTYMTNWRALKVWATDTNEQFQDHDFEWLALDNMMRLAEQNPLLAVAGNEVKLGTKHGQPLLTIIRRYVGSSVAWRFHLSGVGAQGQLDVVDLDAVEIESDWDTEDLDHNDHGGSVGRGRGRGRDRGGRARGRRGGRAAPKVKAKAKPKAKSAPKRVARSSDRSRRRAVFVI